MGHITTLLLVIVVLESTIFATEAFSTKCIFPKRSVLVSLPKYTGLQLFRIEFDDTLYVKRKNCDNNNNDNSKEKAYPIKYHIHNRINQSSQQAAPILVLHGGPGIPSDYLLPLRDVVPYRAMIFYDQLGCGRSIPGPDQKELYSIESSLDDLEFLIKKIGLRRFHLYGQSFGGILAFEYLKRIAERDEDNINVECLSVILSSTPTDVDQVEAVASNLISNLIEQEDLANEDESTIMERFRLKHQCQTIEKPKYLMDSYDHAGKIWRGSECIKGYKATKPINTKRRMPSCMVMRGKNDFVTEECVQGWKDAFNHNFVRYKVLDNCSHHGLLEEGAMYGDTVDSFFSEYD